MGNSCVIFGDTIRNLNKLAGNKEVKVFHTPYMSSASISEIFWSEIELSIFADRLSDINIKNYTKTYQFILRINKKNILLGGDFSSNLQELRRVYPEVFDRIKTSENEIASFFKKYFAKYLYKVFNPAELLDDPILPNDLKEVVLISNDTIKKDKEFGNLINASDLIFFGKVRNQFNELDFLLLIAKLLFPCYLFDWNTFSNSTYSNQVFKLDHFKIEKQDIDKSVIKTNGYSGQHVVDSNQIFSNDMRLVSGNNILQFRKSSFKGPKLNKITFSSENFISNKIVIQLFFKDEPDFIYEIGNNEEGDGCQYYAIDMLHRSNKREFSNTNYFQTSDLKINPIKYDNLYGNFSFLKELHENKTQ